MNTQHGILVNPSYQKVQESGKPSSECEEKRNDLDLWNLMV